MSSEVASKIVEKMFKKYDSDNNQRLSRFEFTDMFNSLAKYFGNQPGTKDDLETIFDLIDVNGDKSI